MVECLSRMCEAQGSTPSTNNNDMGNFGPKVVKAGDQEEILL